MLPTLLRKGVVGSSQRLSNLVRSQVLSSRVLVRKRTSGGTWWTANATNSTSTCFVYSSLGETDTWHHPVSAAALHSLPGILSYIRMAIRAFDPAFQLALL